MTIERMNADFGLGDRLRIVVGKAGFPMIEIDTGSARALISIYAGQVLSYRPAGGVEDLLFLSESAYFTPGRAIKGGIPVCWPWFGPDPEGKGRPAHGFVRNRPWDLLGTEALSDGGIRVHLGLSDSEETRGIWPQAFELELQATVGETLKTELVTRNRGAAAFDITQALHTYFRVGIIGQVQVLGLEGKSYIDKMDGGRQKHQQGAVRIEGEVDRIYTGVEGDLEIRDQALGRTIQIAAAGSASAVVWNPWADTAASMGDLSDDDYKEMLCVETTNAGPDVVSVAAGGEQRLSAEYRVAGL